ncbi:MAG: RagB/SusD family nutrient uptake outer membrane protein, partial [Ferruginibacter sp.]|nr:RagB/SusD family nutrient uptake outer membrane protein [Cytophagales bacterium]
MKRKFAALAVLLLVVSACEQELIQDPITSKDLSVFLQNETEVEEYVNAAYANLQLNGLYGLYLPALAEIPSDNSFDEVPANDAGVYGQLDEFTTIPSNEIVATTWRDSYQGIQKTNVVLNRIDRVAYKTEATKEARKGEMKFIRALLYFNLVRLWGEVPLVTEETTDPNRFFGQGRTPVGGVYDQIKKDLTEAIDALPDASGQPGRV